ncbi:MAG: pilus assembly protein PilM [Rhodocyclaceae bacterium]|nr:pilus assembly protein PilM [Rhodocyclaceae bacterium]MDZ4215850.1 pilus assembly protein PilM [Rhodocyclaceae bacterium]
MEIDLSILNPKARSLVGVDISSSAVKMVELSGSPAGGIQLESYAIEFLPEGAVVDGNIASMEAISDVISRCWKRLNTSTKYVAMAMPTAAVITKKIILPAGLRESEMEIQVESEANQYIPFALEEVNLDFQVIGPSPSSPEEVEVLIAASRKEGVEDRVACAESASLNAVVMDMESYAALSALELIQAQFVDGKNETFALVDIGANAMKITVVKGDQQLYNREQAFGGNQLTQDMVRAYGMSHTEAESLKRTGPMPDNYESEILRPFLDNLALEVSRALQFFFTSTQYSEVHHIVLMGGGALIPGLGDVVAERTQVDAIMANPFEKMALSQRVRPKSLLGDAPSLMVACGLALRRFDQ